MTDRQQLVDTANTIFTNKTTLTGGITTTGASLVSAIAQLDIVAKIGISIALLSLAFTVFSFLMNWRYKYKEDQYKQNQDQRAEQWHQLEMQRLLKEIEDQKNEK
ncbi:phage holin family protein [Acinetobacter pollinis]|uniref:hypothetical protein n=1 Tax=Acinetobacter pollinis TaxID=2605270 RepID=UPI0018C1E564|nr:hypothetical protein [Acinetobacter pollinis]MBF7694280.1 hypothetical protein [Acinetobacter pollinis]MBF7701874.1 hypothetical protein [Acinetobacter pollinis]